MFTIKILRLRQIELQRETIAQRFDSVVAGSVGNTAPAGIAKHRWRPRSTAPSTVASPPGDRLVGDKLWSLPFAAVPLAAWFGTSPAGRRYFQHIDDKAGLISSLLLAAAAIRRRDDVDG